MRFPSIFLFLLLSACGGGIAPSSDTQTAGDPSGDPTGGGTTASSGGGGTSSSDGTSATTTTNVRCTPGSYVFCRCADRSEGTKRCHDDGQSFDACSCETTPPPDCAYPPTSNPPSCPPSYSAAYNGESCPVSKLVCTYPGQGEPDTNGCFAAAILSCRIAPGGSLHWLDGQ